VNLRSFSPLQLAFGASIAAHIVLLSVRFVDPGYFRRIFEDTPLEVILVNARTTERPDKVQAIAQASMAGGGDAELTRATSPLPPAPLTESGDSSEEAALRQLQTLQAQQNMLLTQVKQRLATLPLPDPRQPSNSPEHLEREQKRRQLIRLLAEIEKRINQENARPRKRYISPSTREKVYAVYYDQLRRSIEDKGTENFPEVGGKKLYGELTMSVEINFDGRILKTEVVQGSGNRTLDRRAEAIVRTAAPFGHFSAAMRRTADVISVAPRFKFTREETLETRLNAN
jgi:protein TonB